MYYKIVGGEVMIIGDLHFSDVFTGKHKAYLEECCWVLGCISKKIEERTPSAIVLLGDIIGWVETNIRDREVLSFFAKELRFWGKICPVFAVRGNHDGRGYPDFNLFTELGLIIPCEVCGGYFDYYGEEGSEVPEVRFHLVDYNREDRALNYAMGGASNIVLGHNNYKIAGVTTWYKEHDGIELGLMQNFGDVDMVISGHIHNPSPEIYATQMVSGRSCMLFYPGCPTRPIKDKNMYESCWYVFLGYNEQTRSTDIKTEVFDLQPLDEIFYEDELFLDDRTDAEKLRREQLTDILDDLLKYRMNNGDAFDQIDKIPSASEEAKGVAKRYLQLAYNG